jgi:hypothetical protein
MFYGLCNRASIREWWLKYALLCVARCGRNACKALFDIAVELPEAQYEVFTEPVG